jgi:hypothetical protein
LGRTSGGELSDAELEQVAGLEFPVVSFQFKEGTVAL